MVNISGVSQNVVPGIFTDVETLSNAVNVPGGARIMSILGEGLTPQTIVSSANGDGKDGLNPTYTSSNGSDGRHFLLGNFPVISNRTTLYKNGIPLVGLEAQISSNPFPSSYDYRLNITNGQIELQTAYLVDQGGSFYTPSASNTGQGTIQNLTLQDLNAPTESWTIKCISVQRGVLGNPIPGTAIFTAYGSVSGTILNSNGNPITWTANNTIVSNTILQFSILETKNGSGSTISPFVPGDSFLIQVKGGALNQNDTLTANYIPAGNINNPSFFTTLGSITSNYGSPALGNNLSIGAQLAFANQTNGVLAMQTAPPLPRRTSYNLLSTINSASTDIDTFIVPFPLGVVPDTNSQIHFFVTNPATQVETQLLPNQFPYYTLDTNGDNQFINPSGSAGQPTLSEFIFDQVEPPDGNAFSYTVIQGIASINFAMDGYLNRSLTSSTLCTFSSPSITFNSSNVGQQLKIIDTVNNANNGVFSIIAVSNGQLTVAADGTPPFKPFVNELNEQFNLINPVFNTVVPSSSGSDGELIAIPNTSQAYYSSNSINFSTFPALLGLKLQILTTTLGNNGLFDIVAYNAGTNTLTVQKSFVSENNLEFEVLDPTQTTDYLVLNNNIVPNGNALRVTIVDARDAPFYDAGWLNALATLETQELDILVPLPSQTITAIFQNSLAHCIEMSNILNKKERVLFIGAISGLTPDNLIGNTLAAVESLGPLEGIEGNTVAEVLDGQTEDLLNYSVPNAYGNTYRCVYFWPDQISVSLSGTTTVIDGFYLAAAGAGYLCGQPNIAQPLTNKVLTGFTIGTNKQLSPTVLANLNAAGVTILQPVAGGGNVIQGITTTQSGFIEEEEISIVFIRDAVAKNLRTGFAPFIGTPEDASTIPTLQGRFTALLNSFVSQGLITNYSSPTVVQDSVDPRQFDLTVAVQPSYALSYIYIKVDVGQLS